MKKTLDVLIKEQATGEVSDIGQRLQGNTQVLRNTEVKIAEIVSFQQTAVEAQNEITPMLDALNFIQKTASASAISLMNEPAGESVSLLAERSNQAALDLELIISKLNIEIGGRHLFAGADVDVPPLISATEILDTLQGIVNGMTDAEAIVQAISDWFDAPIGGFSDLAYRPTGDEPRKFFLGQEVSIELNISADTKSIRDTLKGLAIAAMVGRVALDGDISQQRQLLRQGGAIVYDNDINIIAEQSRLGFDLYVVDRIQVEREEKKSSLMMLRNEIKTANPFDTAIALGDVSTRLSIVYSLTDRLSKLSLVDYLR